MYCYICMYAFNLTLSEIIYYHKYINIILSSSMLYIYIYTVYVCVCMLLSFGTHYKCTFSAIKCTSFSQMMGHSLSIMPFFFHISFFPTFFFIVGSCGVKQVLLCFNVSFYFFTKPKHLCCMGPLRMMNEHLMVSILIYWLWNDFLTKLSDCHLYCSSHCVGLSSKLIVLGHSKCCVSIHFLPLKSKLCVEQ